MPQCRRRLQLRVSLIVPKRASKRGGLRVARSTGSDSAVWEGRRRVRVPGASAGGEPASLSAALAVRSYPGPQGAVVPSVRGCVPVLVLVGYRAVPRYAAVGRSESTTMGNARRTMRVRGGAGWRGACLCRRVAPVRRVRVRPWAYRSAGTAHVHTRTRARACVRACARVHVRARVGVFVLRVQTRATGRC